MTAFTGAGTPVTQRLSFNSGQLDFGTNRVVDLDSINIDFTGTVVPLYVVNSIIAADLVRHSLGVTLTAKIKSFSPELTNLAMGSSTSGTPSEADILDGQPTLQNPVVTLYDRNNKEIQYQLASAVFKSYKVATKSQDYTEWDIELQAITMICLNTA
jgi:hypothetical protein